MHLPVIVILNIHDIYYLESDIKVYTCLPGFSGCISIIQFTAA